MCNKMASEHFFAFILLLSHNMLLRCASAVVHDHRSHNVERMSDGNFHPQDDRYLLSSEKHSEFDHEAILGSVKEAEEYDKLSPEESKRRLGLLVPKMDSNGDKSIDRKELKQWILNSFVKLSREEAVDRMEELDANRDGVLTWKEYLQDLYGVDSDEGIDTDETAQMIHDEKEMWKTADTNGDGMLDLDEFTVFTNPEEYEQMYPYLLNETLRDKDKNHDGVIDLDEYIGDRQRQQPTAWHVSERERFRHELDLNGDGVLDRREVHKWLIPDNDDIADEEVEHLFMSADDNNDDLLSYEEIVDHHSLFVGSEATDFGNNMMHFEDEL